MIGPGTPRRSDGSSAAAADFNIVMAGDGRLVEVQGTAEGQLFTRQAMEAVLDLAEKGIGHLLELQRQVLETLTTDSGR